MRIVSKTKLQNLYDLIISEENIKLAFRTIKIIKAVIPECNKTNIINIKEMKLKK